MSIFNRFKKSDILILSFCLLWVLLSVRTNSIWADEGVTYAVSGNGDSIVGMFHRLKNHAMNFSRSNAIGGTPVYFFWEFLWCKIFGISEYAMRSSNFVFAIMFLLGAYKIIRLAELPFWSLLLFALNPVFLYYMNEARPYAAVIAIGLWSFYCLWRYYDTKGIKYLYFFFAWLWLGCAMHMMFVCMGIAYAIVILMHLKEHRLNLKHHIVACSCAFPFFIPLALFYSYLILHAQEVYSELLDFNPGNSILQIAYFFAGLGGVGWSRNVLRLKNLSVSPRICVELSLSIISLLFVFLYFLKHKLFKNKKILLPLLCFSLTMILFVLANIIFKSKFWERHISFVLPIYLFIIVFTCADMLNSRNSRPVRMIAVLAITMQCVSGINIILLDYYQKDDYKGAVEAARRMSPDHILFEGDKNSFNYYGLSGEYAEDITGDSDISGNVNISTASKDVFDSILDRMQGRVVFILCEKKDFDKGNFYQSLGKKGIYVNCFSIITSKTNQRH